MSTLPRTLVFTATALLMLGGCCRDTIREMGSLKDGVGGPRQHEKVAGITSKKSVSTEVERSDDSEKIETGSIAKPDCQGQHIAYQATKEYLKNFGPKPPDQPGEKGPCTPDQH